MTVADTALASFLDVYWDPDHLDLWDLVMDAYERDPVHESLVHTVYDSATSIDGSWAQGCTRAYELTGLSRYLDRAVELLREQRSSESAAIAAVKVYAATGDTQYLDKAQTLYSSIKRQPRGQVIGAATALYGVTRDGSYLSDALSTADRVITRPYVDGVLPPGESRVVLVRQLHRLAVELGQPQYLPFLEYNARQAWSNRRTSDGLIGPNWNSPTPAGPLPMLTAAAGAALLQIVAL